MQDVWFITACHNRATTTASFLSQLAAQTVLPAKLIAVNDGSSDDTAERLASPQPYPIQVLTGDGTLYWGGSLALALRVTARLRPANDTIICFCNDDVTLPNDFIHRAISYSAPGILVLATGIDPTGKNGPDRGCRLDWRLRTRTPHAGEDPTCAPTRGLLVKWADILRIGNIAGRRLPHYHADYEWTMRASRLGMRIITPLDLHLCIHPAQSGWHSRSRIRGLSAWRLMSHRRYSENPRDLVRFAARVAPWPLATFELLRQMLRWSLLPWRT